VRKGKLLSANSFFRQLKNFPMTFANLNELSCNSAIGWKYNSKKVQLAKAQIGEISENHEKVQLAKGGIGEIIESREKHLRVEIKRIFSLSLTERIFLINPFRSAI
jgi:hypothetical protein